MIEVSEARLRRILAEDLAAMSDAMRHAERAIDNCEPGPEKDAMRRDALKTHLAVVELPRAIAARSPFKSRKALRAAVDEEVRKVLSRITAAEMTLRALGIAIGGTKT
jgi:hypothetical protein